MTHKPPTKRELSTLRTNLRTALAGASQAATAAEGMADGSAAVDVALLAWALRDAVTELANVRRDLDALIGD